VLVKRALFFLNAALAIAIINLISQVHPPSFVKLLAKYLNRTLEGKINKKEDKNEKGRKNKGKLKISGE
jgi:hypothetical protein